ncbi:MAG: hypothetical protein NTX50_11760, partial [Candidatus Sumerlaeota bacterium]|nr:hypothetical protein [Candidatus Sumerlaeota bacterium]
VNQGKGAALREGMMKARGNVRAFTDADLPYGVEPLATAMAYIMQRGFHAVLGDRTQAASNTAPASFARRCLSSLASICFRTMLTGGIYDTQCGFKSFRGDVAAEVFSLATVNRFAIDIEVIYMMLKYQLDIKRIPVRLRKSDSSTVKMFQDSFQAFKDIIKVRWNWSRGVYRSEILKQLPEADLSDLTKSFLAQTSGGRQRDTYERL